MGKCKRNIVAGLVSMNQMHLPLSMAHSVIIHA